MSNEGHVPDLTADDEPWEVQPVVVRDSWWLSGFLIVAGLWFINGSIQLVKSDSGWAGFVLTTAYWIWLALRLRRRAVADEAGVSVQGAIRGTSVEWSDILSLRAVPAGQWTTFQAHLARIEIRAETPVGGLEDLQAGAFLRRPIGLAGRMIDACPDPEIRARLLRTPTQHAT